MNLFRPKTIFTESSASRYALTKTILRNFKDTPHIETPNPKELIACIRKKDDPVGAGKKYLLLLNHKGKFLKRCPATKNYICCGYRILHLGLGCTLDCSYCILQSYLNNPLLTLFVNLNDAFRETKAILERSPRQFFRVGTGEFMDSLALDPAAKLSSALVPLFAKTKNAILELKTKTTNIQNLKGLKHNGRTFISWSLNSHAVQTGEERGAAGIKARIEAARKCVEWGYPVGFHFDPIILHKNYEFEYSRTIDRIFERIPPSRIAWISMGCFRFMPGLKPVIRNRFPETKIPYGEFIRGLDGKMRYFKPLRIEAYKTLYERIRKHSKQVTVYLCMESDEVWEKSFGWSPKNSRGLSHLLDQAAINAVHRT